MPIKRLQNDAGPQATMQNDAGPQASMHSAPACVCALLGLQPHLCQPWMNPTENAQWTSQRPAWTSQRSTCHCKAHGWSKTQHESAPPFESKESTTVESNESTVIQADSTLKIDLQLHFSMHGAHDGAFPDQALKILPIQPMRSSALRNGFHMGIMMWQDGECEVAAWLLPANLPGQAMLPNHSQC